MPFANVTILDESKNPTGTWKDRRSQYIVKQAITENKSAIVLITSGNAGYSMAVEAAKYNIMTYCVVDQNINPEIVSDLSKVSEVVQVDLSKQFLNSQMLIKLCTDNDNGNAFLDATTGYFESYEGLLDTFEDEFDYIVCPVGGGEAFLGIHSALTKKGLSTKLVGVTVSAEKSLADKLTTPWRIHQRSIEAVLEAREGSELIQLQESEVIAAYQTYQHIVPAEPSATVVWAAVEKLPTDKKILVINSGKGIF